MKIAYRFQEIYTGVQILIWDSKSEEHARNGFSLLVKHPNNWVLIDNHTKIN